MDKSIFNFQPAGKKSILLSGTKREKYKNSFEMTEKMLVGKQSELGRLGNKCELGNTEYNKKFKSPLVSRIEQCNEYGGILAMT